MTTLALSARSKRTLASGIATVALLLIIALFPWAGVGTPSSVVPPLTPTVITSAEVGPLLASGLVAQPVSHVVLTHLPAEVNTLPAGYGNGCHAGAAAVSAPACVFGDLQSHYSVFLLGDSHAEEWFPALLADALQYHWRLTDLTKSACPSVDPATVTMFNGAVYPQCSTWNRYVEHRMAMARPQLVITTSVFNARGIVHRTGLTKFLEAAHHDAATVVLLGDTPFPGYDVPSCLVAHVRNVADCAFSASAAVPAAVQRLLGQIASSTATPLVPTASWLCATRCPVVVDQTLLYRDNSHPTVAAVTALRGLLAASLHHADPALPYAG